MLTGIYPRGYRAIHRPDGNNVKVINASNGKIPNKAVSTIADLAVIINRRYDKKNEPVFEYTKYNCIRASCCLVRQAREHLPDLTNGEVISGRVPSPTASNVTYDHSIALLRFPGFYAGVDATVAQLSELWPEYKNSYSLLIFTSPNDETFIEVIGKQYANPHWQIDYYSCPL